MFGWFKNKKTENQPKKEEEKEQSPLPLTGMDILGLNPAIRNMRFAPYKAPKTVGNGSVVHKIVHDSCMDRSMGAAVSDFVSQGLNNVGLAAFSEGIGFIGYPYLSMLSLRAEYRMIVETLTKDCTRKWGKIKFRGSDGNEPDDKVKEKIRRLHDVMLKYKVKEHIRHAIALEHYFGISHIMVVLDHVEEGAELQTPLSLDKNKIRKNSLTGFRVIEPQWVSPQAYDTYNPVSEYFYKPQSWWVQAQVVDQTRIKQMISKPVPNMLKPVFNFGGVPTTYMAKPYVDNFLRTRQSVSDMVNSYSIPVLKVGAETLLRPEGMQDVKNRAQIFNALRSNQGLQILNKETEDFAMVSSPLSGLAELQSQSQEQIASVVNIPLLKLLGIQPSGMNASSEGEIRVYYDNITSYRETVVTPMLEWMVKIIQLSEFGEIDESLYWEWDNLYELTERQQVEIQARKTQIDVTLTQNGILKKEDALLRQANDPDSQYSGMDLEMPEEPEFDYNEGGEGDNQQGLPKLGWGDVENTNNERED